MALSQSRYAIVGAGFSGIAVAIQMLRRLRSGSRVFLVNRNHRFGRGLAYGTRSSSHLLNVPAGRMSLFPDEPEDFVRFLAKAGHRFRPGDFVPRNLYGEYLEAALEKARSQAQPGVELEMIQGEVEALEGDATPVLRLSGGRNLCVDHVVMAWGHFAPGVPGQVAGESPRVISDPWAPSALVDITRTAAVLLLGTGLTAYDVALTLLERGHQGRIVMMSRRGLLPQAHRGHDHPPPADTVPQDVLSTATTAREHMAQLRALVRCASEQGFDWRDVMARLRPHTPRLWRQLDARARSQFLRHVLPYWDTHRHRAAPQIDERIRVAVENGRIVTIAGRVQQLARAPDGGVEVQWLPRGVGLPKRDTFEAVVNCTGPTSDLRRVRDPLPVHMMASGQLRPDPLGLGLEVDEQYCMLRADGLPQHRIRYVGPLLKAGLWEATAVPELRAHAQALVQAMIGEGSERTAAGECAAA